MIKTSKKHHHNIIEVQDNGIGINSSHLPKIFDMFFVTQNTNKGSGLGLYITKETV